MGRLFDLNGLFGMYRYIPWGQGHLHRRSLQKKLDEAKIPYAAVGGYAEALHGFAQGTVDIDI